MKKNILVLATRNRGKTREIRDMLKDFPVEIRNLDDFGPIPEIEEDGTTFDENAYKKASFASRILGYPAIADDSGLVVEALNGRPGVRSARYAGEKATDQMNVIKLIKDLKESGCAKQEIETINVIDHKKNRVVEKKRQAAFECVISIAVPTGAALTYEGRCEGIIIDEPRGENGFGYDPVFFYPELGKTFAELTIEEKGRVSHRGRAFQEIVREFGKILTWIDINMPRFEQVECKS
ncbi:MAG: non-canonical purine NTP pyrophosphatase [Desulfamplus sp.]|nr:non-canonical purine NTP pyrophosphatase [Desulfamplus sp.]MBF0411875.1 non-canonical purine NTP pyrophosphatase [Desulfamplus sp.]